MASGFAKGSLLVIKHSVHAYVELISNLVLIEPIAEKFHYLQLACGKGGIELRVTDNLVKLALSPERTRDKFKLEHFMVKIQHVIIVTKVALEEPANNKKFVVE